jgi:lysophospholipase L1-like esterase
VAHSSPTSQGRRRIARPARAILIGIGIVLAALLGPPWFDVFFPPTARVRSAMAALRAARSLYIGFLVAMPWVVAALAIATFAARRRRMRAPWLARALAAGLAFVIGVAVAEGVSAARLAAMRVPFPRLRTRFPDPPGDRVVDVVVVGESSAQGVPYQAWLSVGDIVAWRLRQALPGREFPVTNQALPGHKLDQMHQLLGRLTRRPDLVILYAGHNEFSMRHDWAHGPPYYLDEIPPARATITGLIGRTSRVCRVIDETTGLWLQASPPTRTAARRLVDVPVYTADEYAGRLHDFRVRLEAITAYCEGVGALVVLVIPPGNDADFEPNRSFLPAATSKAEREVFARAFEAVRRLESDDPEAAAASYRELLASQPGFAEAHYRLARLSEQAGRRDEAARHYVAARDWDGLPMRCLSEFQDIYRDVARRHPRAILVDGPAIFRELSPRGTAGDNFFSDGFHPSLIGYTALAEAILKGLHDRRVFGWGEAGPSPIPSVAANDCARHFGMDPEKWREVCDFSAWFYGHTANVRFDPSARFAKSTRYREAALRIRAGAAPEDVGMPGVGTRRIPSASVVLTTRP